MDASEERPIQRPAPRPSRQRPRLPHKPGAPTPASAIPARTPRRPPPPRRAPVAGRERPRPARPPRPAAPAAAKRAWSRPWLLLGALTVALMGLLALATLALTFLYRSDLILPGTRVMDVHVGGLYTDDAATLLAQSWRQQTVALAAGDDSWAVGVESLGLLLNAEATAEQAHQQSRNWSEAGIGLLQERSVQVTPVWSFDRQAAAARLEGLAPQLAIAPVAAGIQFVDGRVEATPPRDGRTFDLAASMAFLEQNAAAVLSSGRLELVTAPVAPPDVDVSAAVAEANQFLAQPLQVRAFDPVFNETVGWEVAPSDWNRWLSLPPAAQPGQVAWQLDTVAAEAYLVNRTDSLGGERYLDMVAAVAALERAIARSETAVSLRVYHHERLHTVQAGETFSSIARDYGAPYPWIQRANPGIDTLWPGQQLIIPSPDVFLPLPVVENKRIIISIGQQLMWAYDEGVLRWEWPVSTGIDSSPTSPGVFQVQSHETTAYASNWDLWMPYFIGIYQPVPTSDFMNGFHGFPTRGGQTLLWTSSLGHKVTYGCILVSTDNAVQLFDWAEDGVVVEIQP